MSDHWDDLSPRERGLRLGVSLLARYIAVIGVTKQITAALENVARQSMDGDERNAVRLSMIALAAAERELGRG